MRPCKLSVTILKNPMLSDNKYLKSLTVAVLITFSAMIILGLYMPLQTDEVAYLMLNHRALIDGGQIYHGYPQCGVQQFSHPLPWVWYLPAYFNDLTYARVDHPIWIRIGGIIQFFMWFFLWIAIAIKLFNIPRINWPLLTAILLAFLGLDALPLSLLVNRPEQILLIGVGAFILFALYAREISKSLSLQILATLLLFFVAMYMHAIHPKSITLLPFEVMTGGLFLKHAWRSRLITCAGIVLLFWIAMDSYIVAAQRLQCPDSPLVRHILAGIYLSPSALLTSPGFFSLVAICNLIASFFSALSVHYHITSVNAWIPLSLQPMNALMVALIDILDAIAWLIYICVLFMTIRFCYRGICVTGLKKIIPEASANLPSSTAWLGIITLLSGLLAVFTLMTAYFYAASFAVPLLLLMLMLILSLRKNEITQKHPRFIQGVNTLLLLAVVNHIVLLERYSAFITEPEAHNSTISRRVMTISAWGYENRLKDIKELESLCNVHPNVSSNHIVTDDTTYFRYHYGFEPLPIYTSVWIKPEFKASDYFELLRQYNSDGVISACQNFPSKLLPYAIKHGDFCCIPKAIVNSPRLH